MKILFTGDVNFRGFENLDGNRSRQTLEMVEPYINKADFVIPNLECPLGDKEKYTPIKKSGPNLICDAENICFLKEMRAYAVTLANNHMGDFGGAAVKDTLKLLDENNIGHTGAGENISDAYEALRIEKNGVSVSILSVCENEFGIANETEAGSAGYSPRRLFGKIRDEKERSDFVVVVFHGGNEFCPLPSPDTAERYRMLCDMGADAVVAGHTHCPQGFEVYDGKPIVYSMGNFVFKSSSERDKNNSWYYGYFTLLDAEKTGLSFRIVPYRFDEASEKIIVFEGGEKAAMLDYIDGLSRIIENEKELKRYFSGWALLHPWFPRLPENIDDLGNYNAAECYDLISCEAHLSQAMQLAEVFLKNEVADAKVAAEEISALQKMPV